jgi:hypothetical protein
MSEVAAGVAQVNFGVEQIRAKFAKHSIGKLDHLF